MNANKYYRVTNKNSSVYNHHSNIKNSVDQHLKNWPILWSRIEYVLCWTTKIGLFYRPTKLVDLCMTDDRFLLANFINRQNRLTLFIVGHPLYWPPQAVATDLPECPGEEIFGVSVKPAHHGTKHQRLSSTRCSRAFLASWMNPALHRLTHQPAARFTDNLRIILRQFSHLQSS